MSHAFKKFVAVSLAVWLPLFSGNALAMHTAMPNGGGVWQTTTSQQDHSVHQLQHQSPQDQPSPHHSQQDSACENCDACHFACSGFMSTASVTVTPMQFDPLSYPSLSTTFLSFISSPLDPPPLARV